MRLDLMAAALAKSEPNGVGAQEVTLGAIATGAVVWGASFIRGTLKEREAERLELAAAVKRSDEAFDALSITVAQLQVAVAKCETHREHDAKERERLFHELSEVKKIQIENSRILPEGN